MKRISPVFLGFLLLLSGSILLFGSEFVRRAMEREISRFFGVPVHVARATLTPRRLTLHGISFQMPRAASIPLIIERLELEGSPRMSNGSLILTGVNLSVAGLPLRAQGKVFLTSEKGSYARSDGWLTLEHPLLSGRVEVAGRLLEPVVLGWVQGVGGSPRHFVGQWKIRRDSLELLQMEIQGGWRAAGKLSARSRGELNIAGPEERVRLKVTPLGPGSTRAEWWMYRPDLPARQVTAEWGIERNRLQLQARFEDAAQEIKGWVNLHPPYRTRLTLRFQDLPVEELAKWLEGTSSPAVSGRLEGEIRLSGSMQNLNSQGDLMLRDGKLGEGVFETVGLRFDGKGPLLEVESTVRVPSQKVYVGEGRVDLRRIGQPEFLNALRWNSTDRDLQMAGWLMSLAPGGGGLQMQRPLGSKESVKISMQKEEQVVAVEHRKKF
ncbi:MAG: hypothetical protein HYZ88_00825 [Candidatus Omnitrophica bacterium]|nr:hypothetical protein [Candidatus Omnitrophota bacterium]